MYLIIPSLVFIRYMTNSTNEDALYDCSINGITFRSQCMEMSHTRRNISGREPKNFRIFLEGSAKDFPKTLSIAGFSFSGTPTLSRQRTVINNVRQNLLPRALRDNVSLSMHKQEAHDYRKSIY